MNIKQIDFYLKTMNESNQEVSFDNFSKTELSEGINEGLFNSYLKFKNNIGIVSLNEYQEIKNFAEFSKDFTVEETEDLDEELDLEIIEEDEAEDIEDEIIDLGEPEEAEEAEEAEEVDEE